MAKGTERGANLNPYVLEKELSGNVNNYSLHLCVLQIPINSEFGR